MSNVSNHSSYRIHGRPCLMGILGALLIFVSHSASALTLADFEGRWLGSGTATWHSKDETKQVQCSEIAYSLDSPSQNIFSIDEGGYSCDNDLNASYPSSQFVLRGEDLLYEGKPVGKFKETGITLLVTDPEEDYVFEFSLEPKIEAGKKVLAYRENWFEILSGNQKRLKLSIQGLLSTE